MSQGKNPDFDSLLPEALRTRRAFVVTSLATGFALAVKPALAQSVIHTDSVGLLAGEVRIDGMPAYRAQPADRQNLATILVVSEIFGVHEHIADICRRLAKLGYLAVAPELFARHGDPKKLASVQEILSTIVSKVSDAEVLADLDATAAWAAKNGGDPARLGITGFCWGGRIVWLYCAHQPRVKAGVAWYGRLDGEVNGRTPRWPLDVAAELKAPVLGLYGGQDQGIPLEDVEAMQEALQKAGGKSTIHVYPDAGHAFLADYRPTYRKAAAEDGWRRMLEWFAQHGVKP